MSYVVAAPESLAAASQNLSSIGSAINEAHAAAAVSTTTVVAAAQDEVSAAIAAVFGGYAQDYQALAGQAAALHDQFVHSLNTAGNAYAATEAANASPLRPPAAGVQRLSLEELNALNQRLYRILLARQRRAGVFLRNREGEFVRLVEQAL